METTNLGENLWINDMGSSDELGPTLRKCFRVESTFIMGHHGLKTIKPLTINYCLILEA